MGGIAPQEKNFLEIMTCAICSHLNRPNAHYCASCRAPLLLQERYRITALLGRGGYGAVYRAEHLELQTLCAIKEILPEKKAGTLELREAEEQFRVEAAILSKLEHPAIPQVRDFFVESRTKRQYLVMDLIEGKNLETLLQERGKPFESDQVMKWLATLCEILTYLHTQKPNPVIHRDLNPRNILLTNDGSLKLVDFGIAKVAHPGARTQVAARAVSPPYSPWEQYGKGTDARSDIYALGITAYQLVTNQLPPEAPDRANEKLVTPSEHNPNIPAWLSDALFKAMAREPADRFQTAEQFQRALAPPPPPPAPVVTSPVLVATPVLAPSITRPLPRQRSGLPWIPFGLVALVGIAILFFLSSRSNSALPPLSTSVPAAAPTHLAAQSGSVPTVFLTARAEPTFTRTRPIPFSTLTRIPPTLARALAPPTLTPIPPRGVVLQNWLLRQQNGIIIQRNGKIPPKTRFAFELNLTNNTDTDFLLSEFTVQTRAVGAAYVWNLNALDTGSIGLGQTKKIVTQSLDLGAGSFIATALYRGKAITDDRNAPYQFSFQVGR
ncbi:MAG: hypothetical protein B6D41_00340 [Chloroflexi bacterium UTCFX4]|nr:MAG: hypothetical protein B6D41_00340 [Chloroflexi bacterium UTCFX4]